jgi:hypothetical protein
MHDSDRVRLFAAIDKLCCVMQDENWRMPNGSHPLACAEEMTSQNLLFADAFVRQKPIRCLRSSPILASKRNTATDLLGKLPEQSAKSLAVPKILKLAARHLTF